MEVWIKRPIRKYFTWTSGVQSTESSFSVNKQESKIRYIAVLFIPDNLRGLIQKLIHLQKGTEIRTSKKNRRNYRRGLLQLHEWPLQSAPLYQWDMDRALGEMVHNIRLYSAQFPRCEQVDLILGCKWDGIFAQTIDEGQKRWMLIKS